MKDGIILIDKPAGLTSFGVVARIRRVLSEQRQVAQAVSDPTANQQKRKKVKVGHTGTLDPFATGLMILVVGEECKNAGTYSKLDKVYEATIHLGQTSTTGDPEGDIAPYAEGSLIPTLAQIQAVMNDFRGTILQRPPIFSAIKINGQRAYKLARDGEEVEIPLRQVEIHSLEILSYSYPELKIRTHVGSGTYIRSLAVDIGAKLGTGAYCSELRRLKVSNYDVADAKTLAAFGITS